MAHLTTQSVPRPAARRLPEFAEHVVRSSEVPMADAKTRPVIFPENASQQPVPRLAV